MCSQKSRKFDFYLFYFEKSFFLSNINKKYRRRRIGKSWEEGEVKEKG